MDGCRGHEDSLNDVCVQMFWFNGGLVLNVIVFLFRAYKCISKNLGYFSFITFMSDT